MLSSSLKNRAIGSLQAHYYTNFGLPARRADCVWRQELGTFILADVLWTSKKPLEDSFSSDWRLGTVKEFLPRINNSVAALTLGQEVLQAMTFDPGDAESAYILAVKFQNVVLNIWTMDAIKVGIRVRPLLKR